MLQPEYHTPGLIELPRGRLRLPTRLVVGADDISHDVQWSAWRGEGTARICEGVCDALRLTVTVTGDIAAAEGLHCRSELLNTAEQACELREWAWTLELEPPDRVALVADADEQGKRALRHVSDEPWDYNLTADMLAADGRCWSLALAYGRASMCVGSDDPLVFGDGLARCEPAAMDSDRIKVAWHRIEPHWDYNGLLSTRPLHGLWVYEGQTREANLRLAEHSEAVPVPPRGWGASPLPPPPSLPEGAALPLCIPAAAGSADTVRVLAQLDRFHISRGEYAGLYAGGVDYRNRRHLEPHVCRAEYGEFLLHAHLRGDGSDLWPGVVTYAERFQQTAVNRGGHPERCGAVRGRYGDNQSAHRIRSMRGAAFFWDMHRLTGREDFRRTAVGIADYLTRSFPWNNARQGAAIRDLVYLHQQTGEARYRDTAQAILRTLQENQHDSGGWYEYWNKAGEAFAYDPPGHHGGQWTACASLKPEMASYNVNALLDVLLLLNGCDLLPGVEPMVRKAADWLCAVQDKRGGWRFPNHDSRGLYGYGLYLDAAAMFKAGWFFRDRAFIDAGTRAVAFGFELLDTLGHVPSVTDLPDIDQTECSLTWFFAIEALAAQSAAEPAMLDKTLKDSRP
ncbi:hypothetical protein ACERK3_14790 [Phycisphaerales bacterium AB-hyl4]|uniref:Uncharacterized protein n=1 Tax=Natronomicrosphaera hydrolytica TaxID=3242702 RepID=A0ABV4U7I2_9BACT